MATWYDVMNYDLEEDFLIGGKKAALCGAEKEFLTDIMDGLKEGDYPQNNEEIMLSENAKEILGVRIGDTISVDTPSGTSSYTISGFCGDTGYITQHDAIGAFLSRTAFEKLGKENDCQSAPAYYVQFREHTNARKVISDIREQYGFTEETMSENTAVLGIMGFSSDNYMMGLYLIAAVLFVLVLLAGVFMIAGSINSNVSERTQFFGMMRCIGASRQQVMHFVRLEALSWCKISIPVGVISGSVDKNLVAKVGEMPGVKRVFGRMYRGCVPVDSDQNVEKVDLISYEKYQLNWAADDLVKGELSKLEAGGDYVLVVYERSNPLTVGDKITLSGTELEVCGVLSTSPFSSTDVPTVICSEETFRKLTGESNYSMSVSARVKQYGAMRAVGMDGRQLTKMIAAEAATYAIFGSMVGCVLGLKTNQFMYEKLITAYWGDAWSMPVRQLIIILILVFAAVAVAVYAPAKRIRNMQITEIINEL